MKKLAMKKDFYVFKKTWEVNTTQGKVTMNKFTVDSPSCYRRIYANVGDRVKVVAGKKIPKDTVATIKYVKDNPFEHVQDSLTGEYYNPSVLLRLDNGEEVWTSGKNLVNVKPDSAIAGPFEFDSLEEATKTLGASKEYYSTSPFWHITEDGKIHHETAGLSDHGMSIKESKEVGDEIVMILDDWRSDTYPFLVIKKEFKPGNTVKYVRTGIDRRLTDMNDPAGNGYSEAKKLFENYGKKE